VNQTCAATSLRKAAWKARLLEALYKQLPQCEGRVAYADVGSPLTNDFYLGSVKGEVYGLEHTVERYATLNAQLALHPQTTVRGLFMTGQDTMNVVRRRPPSPASNGQRRPVVPVVRRPPLSIAPPAPLPYFALVERAPLVVSSSPRAAVPDLSRRAAPPTL
jgi:hypothetical protein